MNKFVTNVANFETETGDKILYPFSPPIFQTEVDTNFTKELIVEGRKLTKEEDDWNPRLAGNLKYGRSYHYKEDYILKVEPYLKTYVERFFNGIYSQFGKDNKMILNKLLLYNFFFIFGKIKIDINIIGIKYLPAIPCINVFLKLVKYKY